MTIIQGNNLYLRPYSRDDAAAVLAGANEPVGRKLTGTHATFTLEQIIAYIENNHVDDSRAGFVICLPDGTVTGEVVINQIDTDNHRANIRIALFAEQYFGQGLGTEALRLMVDYGFKTLKLHRIELGVYAFNPRAIRVYEKLGFKREGLLRDALFYDDAYHDEIVMSLLEHEWQG
ncbi:MAG: GNAT family N-acetyltransferase [Anaerolineaceae bacterium]|nr:GNAT family N-acetyltransferase [Anaerolineaceae bacterium]